MTRKSRNLLLFFLTGGGILLIFLLLGPPKLLAKSEHPSFCAGCHVMEAEYEAWAHTGAHRRKACVDCHLPNENVVVHYVWKAIDGMKDVPSSIQARCRSISNDGTRERGPAGRTASAATNRPSSNINQERKCWECHRRIMHTRSGALQTI